MEQLGISSSSKVTVEYADPSELFPLLSDELQRRLPLRNLHWKSSSRPLRSINSLHIELVPDRRPISQDLSSIKGSEDRVYSNPNGVKERRHQIPGLRETPYLKIYLLQCNEPETYKATSRRLLREWVKENTPPSQNSSSISKAENHDAFEWLILHVLSPTSPWPSRSSATVIEKIRSDFNGTSKTAVDRVAQIYINEDLESSRFSVQQSAEAKKGFDDLISKLKSLILASFDQRVRQYEDDIREKDSQRNLPGWNFNTFFVLKEGLAKGFERVGLIEDALTSYHELSTSLNKLVAEEQTRLSRSRQPSPFCEFTNDLSQSVKQAVSAVKNNSPSQNILSRGEITIDQESERISELGAAILDTERKPFRELILENNISAFDFLCYVFARQVSLLLRLAKPAAPNQAFHGKFPSVKAGKSQLELETTHSAANHNEHETENLSALAEICRRALEFITFINQVIRSDLNVTIHQFIETKEHLASKDMYDGIIEDLVSSWTYSACQCILENTSVRPLSTQVESLLHQFKSRNDMFEIIQEVVTGKSKIVPRDDILSRSSFNSQHNPEQKDLQSREQLSSVVTSDVSRPLVPEFSRTGFQDLAAQRAQLFNVATRTFCSLGLRHGNWKVSVTDFASLGTTEDKMDEVNLENGTALSVKTSSQAHPIHNMNGVQNKFMHVALQTKQDFYRAYEDLTALALAHFVIGDMPKSADAMTAGIAIARFHLDDYGAAASIFHQLAPIYAKDVWNQLQNTMLDMYARCLKHMRRDVDYVRTGLKIISKFVRESLTQPETRRTLYASSISMRDMIVASTQLHEPILASLESHLGTVALEPYIRHVNGQDGFQMQLKICSLISETIEAQQIQVKLIGVEDDQHSELWLAAHHVHSLPLGTVSILVSTNSMIPGWYVLSTITIRSENIIFTHEALPSNNSALFLGSAESNLRSVEFASKARILLWPQAEGLDVRLSLYNMIHLEQPRSILINIFTGWNEISQGKLSLRAGSAGLRLHTADGALVGGKAEILDQSRTGTIVFGKASKDTILRLRIPYALESDLKEITIKVEISYTTVNGDFAHGCNLKASTMLPLGVNVQDIFQEGALFSKFTISTAFYTPLRIFKCFLQSSAEYKVSSPSLADDKLDIFTRQPLSLISRIYPKSRNNQYAKTEVSKQVGLLLQIQYCCLDQQINEALERCICEALASSELCRFSRLLVSSLIKKFCTNLSNQELEAIGLLREIPMGRALESAWNSVSSGVQPELRDEIAKWVLNWQEKHITIPILDDSEPLRVHHLSVPVEIPKLNVVHTACIRLHSSHMEAPMQDRIVAVGQALSAELVITHSRKWSSPEKPMDDILDFCFEVHASPDTWLIGGQKKAHFSAKEGEILSFPLLLLPQKTGRLLYPSVDIIAYKRLGDEPTADQSSLMKPLPICETDYRSQGDTLVVVPDLSRTIVSLDNGSSAGGAWLVESKSGQST